MTAVAFGASVVAALLAHGAMVMAERRAASPGQRPFAIARDDGMAHDCWGSLLENATAPCIFGDTTSRTTVVLMGDSHAEHWLPAVDRIGRERHWKIVAMVKPACPVADMPELVNARLKRELRRVHRSGGGRCCGGSSRCVRRSRFSRAGITTCRPTETDRTGR